MDVQQLDVGPWKLDGGRSYVVRWILSAARSTRWTLDSGRSTKDVGRKTFDSARCTLFAHTLAVVEWTLDIGCSDVECWTLDVGHWIGRTFRRWTCGCWTLDVGRRTLDVELWNIGRWDVGRWTLDVGTFDVRTLDIGRKILDVKRGT